MAPIGRVKIKYIKVHLKEFSMKNHNYHLMPAIPVKVDIDDTELMITVTPPNND